MRKFLNFLIIALLVVLPLNVFAVSGHMTYRYKITGDEFTLTILANVKTGTLNKYTADLTLSDNLTYSSITGLEGWTATYEDNKIVATHTGLGVGNALPAVNIIFTRSNRDAWSIKASNSQMCEGEVCVNVHNNYLPATSSSGKITNPNTVIKSLAGAVIIASFSFAVYHFINRKKLFDNL